MNTPIRLIKPSYKINSIKDRYAILKSIEEKGRICYKSEDKITDNSASKFVRNIIKKGHESVLEHESISVIFICDRGISHEIVRHRLASYSQESTRYVNYKDKGITFIIPPWCKHIKEDTYISKVIFDNYFTPEEYWFETMYDSAEKYYKLIGYGWSPQQARSVLPNSLKTEIVVTANLREWRHILQLRTSAKAHPQIVEVMKPLLEELKNCLPEIFENIGEKQ